MGNPHVSPRATPAFRLKDIQLPELSPTIQEQARIFPAATRTIAIRIMAFLISSSSLNSLTENKVKMEEVVLTWSAKNRIITG
jgi:hypothetical protein